MYGLTKDFIRNGGAFMVLEKAEGLRMDELSRVQTGMMSANDIPRLLPLHIREMDRNVTLQYDISGYKMLSQFLKAGKIKLRVLYGLLFQLADTFTECRQYMLEPRKLMLQEESIFVKGSLEQGELGMVYVPIQDSVVVDPTPAQFRELVIRLMAHVQELQGEGIQRVLQLCDNERWDVGQLRELLLELYADEQAGHGSSTFLSSRVNEPRENGTVNERSAYVESEPEFAQLPRLHRQHARSKHDQDKMRPDTYSNSRQQLDQVLEQEGSNSNKLSPNFLSTRPSREGSSPFADRTDPVVNKSNEITFDENMEMEQKTGTSKVTYIILICMVGIALVWRFAYMEQPGQTPMIISIVLSVALLAVAGWAWISKGKFGITKAAGLRRIDQASFLNLGHKRTKNEEEAEELYQESWRWNQSEWKTNNDPPAPGYASIASTTLNSRFQRLHTEPESEPESSIMIQQQFDHITAPTSELIRTESGTEATVNLQSMTGEAAKGADPVTPSFYLERRLGASNRNERMDVQGASFVIGRSAEMVQWVDSTTGVSRAHVELSRNKSGYVIKDLGSVNGTLLQGKPLAPYKEYPLEDGDTFMLAESVYTYRSVG
ncbi:hypothetical protein ABIC22_000602 [Paenibacillus sp. PvP094]|uniref:DUF6382 domain-containing protein n=1 Tax=Paenibacillus sp. PvP094 TaxID=3156394 RepID=UPI003395BC2D